MSPLSRSAASRLEVLLSGEEDVNLLDMRRRNFGLVRERRGLGVG